MLGFWSDITGIIGFFVSIFTFIAAHTILRDVKIQRREFENERYQLQTTLTALRDNVWKDNIPLNMKIRSKIREAIFTYQQKYFPISSPSCIFHVYRATIILKKINISSKQREKLCISLDFLIARYNKTEVIKNEQ